MVIMASIMILFLAAMAKWAMMDVERKLGHQTGVNANLSTVDAALANFVAQNKRLPCPADGAVASGQANAGVEMAFPACNSQTRGVVPWVALGINENDARDPWNGRITYRVDPALAAGAPLLMDMSKCDVSGTGSVAAGGVCRTPTPTCIANPTTCTSPATFLANKGLDVWNGVGAAVGWATRQNNRPGGSGAAYVIISHGATGAGAYNSNGILQPGTIGLIAKVPPPGTQAAGNDELLNMNNQNLVLAGTQANSYRDAPFDTSRTPSNFDDSLSHPTIRTVLSKVGLQERVH
jgi:hypothetical protein